MPKTSKTYKLKQRSALISMLIWIVVLCSSANGYLQFELIRTPHSSKKNPYAHQKPSQCISMTQTHQKSKKTVKKSEDQQQDNDDQQNDRTDADYQQICYDKDISYAIELYDNKDQLYHLSVDLTTPYSWFKGNRCLIWQQVEQKKDQKPNDEGHDKPQKTKSKYNKKKHERCKRIEVHFKDQLKQFGENIKELGDKLKGRKGRANQEQNSKSLVQITGSSEIVKGYLQNLQDLQFWTKDSGRLSRITDILLLGFYFLDERDKLSLKQTNFINATKISKNLNYLCDGAISLRADQNSQKSFLREIFEYVQSGSGITNEQIVTIYIAEDLGKSNSITIGQMSVKHAQGGYSSISWVKVEADDNYGKVPALKQIIWAKTEQQDSHKVIPDQKHLPVIQVGIDQIYAIFTLSASYISLPEKQLQQVLGKISKMANCSVDKKTNYVQCQFKNKEFENQQLIFDFSSAKMTFNISQLILKRNKPSKKSQNVTLLLRQGYNQGYAIFGEPVFKKYMLLFDFTKDRQRVGIAPRRFRYGQEFVNVVSLIRFVVFVFFFGCCIIICFEPVRRMMNAYMKADFSRWSRSESGSEGRRLRQYSPIQQNPYQDLKGKIQQAINTEGSGDIVGI